MKVQSRVSTQDLMISGLCRRTWRTGSAWTFWLPGECTMTNNLPADIFSIDSSVVPFYYIGMTIFKQSSILMYFARDCPVPLVPLVKEVNLVIRWVCRRSRTSWSVVYIVLNTMCLLIQGVPGEAGAAGATGPRVSHQSFLSVRFVSIHFVLVLKLLTRSVSS